MSLPYSHYPVFDCCRPQDLDPSAFVQQDRPWWHCALGLPEQEVGLMGQGLQRVLDSSGKVKPLEDPSKQLVDALGGTTSVFLSGKPLPQL